MYISIKIAQMIRKFMDLLKKEPRTKTKSSRIKMFSLSFSWDILSVLVFTFTFVPMIVKWLMCLHVSCLHINRFRKQ